MGDLAVSSDHSATLPPASPMSPITKLEINKWFADHGEFVDPAHPFIEVKGCIPVSGEFPSLGKLPNANKKFAERVLSRALEAFDNGMGEWASLDISKRADSIYEVVTRVFDEYGDQAAELLMWEIGKKETDARSELDRTREFVLEACENAPGLFGKAARSGEDTHLEELFEKIDGRRVVQALRPIGVVQCFGPSNYPINESLESALGAVIAGNSVILKLPKFGAYSLAYLAEKISTSLPKGVFQLLPGEGSEVVPPIMKSPNLRGLVFIGGSKTLDTYILPHNPSPRKLVMILGLGAKNPIYIHESANLDHAVNKGVDAALRFNGQRCTGGKIFLVDDSIYDSYSAKLVQKVASLKLGAPFDPEADITPLYDPRMREVFDEFVRDALEQGATLLNPGGYDPVTNIYSPVVLGDVTNSMAIYHEEQFGPIVPLVRVESSDDVIEYCINSEMGQQIATFSNIENCRDSAAREALSAFHQQLELLKGPHLQAVNINDIPKRLAHIPFGAVKDSGFGYVDVDLSVTAFTEQGYTTFPL